MKRILLILEDYNEMVFVETILKKVGFDCLGLQNDHQLSDKVLSFAPALIIAEGFGRKINGLQLTQKLKRPKGQPRLLLVVTLPDTIDEADCRRLHIHGLIERPVHPGILMEAAGTLLNMDVQSLKDKLVKLGLFQEGPSEKSRVVSGPGAPKIQDAPAPIVRIKDSSLPLEERQVRFKKALEGLPVVKENGLDRKKVTQQTKEFRSRESDPEIMSIDEERFAFARSLFKK